MASKCHTLMTQVLFYMCTAFLLQQTRSSPRAPSGQSNNYHEAVNLIKVTANPAETDGQWSNNSTCRTLTQLFSFFNPAGISICRFIYLIDMHGSEEVADFISSNRLIFFVCLSQKVPSNPRLLWTQLSSADSTSVDTDYEQYDPSIDPSVSLSTFRSEPRSFIFPLHLCVVSQPLLLCLTLFLHFAVEAALSICMFVCVCVWADHAVLHWMFAGCSVKYCIVCIVSLFFKNPDSQRYRTDVNPLMRPSGLESLCEEGESQFVCKVVTLCKTQAKCIIPIRNYCCDNNL